MALPRFVNQGSRVGSSGFLLRALTSKASGLEEGLGWRLSSHAFASTSVATGFAPPSATDTPAAHPHGGLHVRPGGTGATHSNAPPPAHGTSRQYHSSSRAPAASHQAEEPPVEQAAVAPILASVLEKAMRDQFPLGPHPQVVPSLLTASMADLLKVSQSLAAVNGSVLPVRHPSLGSLPGSELSQQLTNAPGREAAPEQQPAPARAKRKAKKQRELESDVQNTGIGIKARNVAGVKAALKKRLGGYWAPFLRRSFDEVPSGAASDSGKQMLPPVSQIADSVDCLLACFGGMEDAQEVLRNCLLRCPQLLAAPRTQLLSAIGFLEFLNLSPEEMASCLQRRPSLLLEDLETRLFPLCEYLDSIGIPPEQQRLIVVKRPHVMVQPLEDVRGVMAFLVGHGVAGAALTHVVTSAKGLLTIRRPLLALRMRMLRDFLGGNALDVTQYPDILMMRTWRVGARVALVRHHGREVLMPSQVSQTAWNTALRSSWVRRKDVPIAIPKILEAHLERVCERLGIPLADGVAFVERWEAEEGGKWSETSAPTSQHAAAEAAEKEAEGGAAVVAVGTESKFQDDDLPYVSSHDDDICPPIDMGLARVV